MEHPHETALRRIRDAVDRCADDLKKDKDARDLARPRRIQMRREAALKEIATFIPRECKW